MNPIENIITLVLLIAVVVYYAMFFTIPFTLLKIDERLSEIVKAIKQEDLQ